MSSSSERRQRTLEKRVSLSGIGVHSGAAVTISIGPASPDSGIVFLRGGLANCTDIEIPARSHAVGSTELCTVLGGSQGASVGTVEHLLAALAGLGIDNALIEIDGPEVPVMDGSAGAFVEAIDTVGIRIQAAPRHWIRIEKPVRVELGSAHAEFRPHPRTRLEISIDYDCSVIGKQTFAFDLSPKCFRREIARARTFGYMRDVERLWAAGYALGSSLENSVVIGDGKVVNPEGLRYPDEFVRHKVLDTIGDLALAGMSIQGLYCSHKGGHKLNALALSTLLSRTDCWSIVSSAVERESRPEGRGELATGLSAPAFAPDVL
jgi:UDP-3-O-[3-hydroxymyristoyl] N-acetylglucosamine deacetylase